MTIQKDILGIVPGLQATALVGENLKLLKIKKTKNAKGFTKKFVKTGVKNIFGISMIGAASKIINTLD